MGNPGQGTGCAVFRAHEVIRNDTARTERRKKESMAKRRSSSQLGCALWILGAMEGIEAEDAQFRKSLAAL